jgi:hypothetical protein
MVTTIQSPADPTIVSTQRLADQASLANLAAALALLQLLLNKTTVDREATLKEFAGRLNKEAKPENATAAFDSIVKPWLTAENRFKEQTDGLTKLREGIESLQKRVADQMAEPPDQSKGIQPGVTRQDFEALQEQVAKLQQQVQAGYKT